MRRIGILFTKSRYMNSSNSGRRCVCCRMPGVNVVRQILHRSLGLPDGVVPFGLKTLLKSCPSMTCPIQFTLGQRSISTCPLIESCLFHSSTIAKLDLSVLDCLQSKQFSDTDDELLPPVILYWSRSSGLRPRPLFGDAGRPKFGQKGSLQ